MKVYSTQSEKLLSWMFKMIICGLKSIGLAPVSLQTGPPTRNLYDTSINVFSYSKMGLLYNLVLSILTLIIGTLEMRQVFSISYPNKTSVNQTLDIAQYFLEIFTAWFAMVYWAFRQEKGAAIMNRLLDVHCLLPPLKEQLSNKRMLIFLVVHITLNASLWMTFFVSAQIFYNSLFNTIAICTPIFVSYWFLVEYSIVLGFVARELETLNANLLILGTFPIDPFRTFLPNSNLPVLTLPSHKQLADIKLLHRIRATLDEVSQDIADFFSLPMLPIILLYFCMIVYHVYYIVVPILTPDSDLTLSANIFVMAWLIISVYPLVLLSFYVTKTTKKAQLTGHVVHKLMASERKREVIAESTYIQLPAEVMKVFPMQSEGLLSRTYKIIIYGLKAIGLAPVSLHTTALTRNSRKIVNNVFLYSNTGLIYNILLSIVILIIGVLQMQKLTSPRHSKESLFNHIMDLGQYVLIIFTTWFVIIHWAFQQKKAASIMNRLLGVHSLHLAQKKQSSNKRVFIFLVMHMTFTIFVFITFFVSTKAFYNSFFDAFSICTPLFVSYSFLVEYSIVLGFIAKELESLNVNLSGAKEFPDPSQPLLPYCDLPVLVLPAHNWLADIKLLHSIHTTIYEVSQDVADFFSLPILPIILLFFYMTVYNVYYIVIPAFIPERGFAPIDNIFIVAWLIIGVYPLILLSSYTTKALKEAKKTGHLVHKLLATARTREIVTELEQFSLHLIHEDFSFTAYGFFTLDFKLLQSIFGATATYLVIIIQFVQSSKT